MLSSLICGNRKCNFDKTALPMVKKALCTGSRTEGCNCYSCTIALSSHPDLITMDSPSAEDIDRVISFAETAPMISGNRVVYLKGLSSVTEVSQNKLLKELEDNSTFVLVATADSSRNSVLPTVRSRMETIILGPETECEFQNSLSDGERAEGSLLYTMTGGYSSLAEEMRGQVPVYRDVQTTFESHDGTVLLTALNLVTDKDKNCYFEKYAEYVPQLFDFMAAVSMRENDPDRSVNLLRIINREKANSLNGWYTRVNFFTSIATIAEAL